MCHRRTCRHRDQTRVVSNVSVGGENTSCVGATLILNEDRQVERFAHVNVGYDFSGGVRYFWTNAVKLALATTGVDFLYDLEHVASRDETIGIRIDHRYIRHTAGLARCQLWQFSRTVFANIHDNAKSIDRGNVTILIHVVRHIGVMPSSSSVTCQQNSRLESFQIAFCKFWGSSVFIFSFAHICQISIEMGICTRLVRGCE